jgi:hypothetical protein
VSGEPPLTPEERELAAAYAEQVRQMRIEQLLASTVQTALELGFLRTGMEPAAGVERDLGQVELAVETVRALIPVIERLAGTETANAYRAALSDLQLAYASASGTRAPAPDPPSAAGPGQPPPPRQPDVETPPRPKIWTPRGDV